MAAPDYVTPICRRLEINQAKLAELCGVLPSTVSNWKSQGRSIPSQHVPLLIGWGLTDGKDIEHRHFFESDVS